MKLKADSDNTYSHEVTLCVRVWIEMANDCKYDRPCCVTLCVRVWIEIGIALTTYITGWSHPLREGVD